MKSGGIVQRRAQVLIGSFELERRRTSTFFISLTSTKGPFFSERPITSPQTIFKRRFLDCLNSSVAIVAKPQASRDVTLLFELPVAPRLATTDNRRLRGLSTL